MTGHGPFARAVPAAIATLVIAAAAVAAGQDFAPNLQNRQLLPRGVLEQQARRQPQQPFQPRPQPFQQQQPPQQQFPQRRFGPYPPQQGFPQAERPRRRARPRAPMAPAVHAGVELSVRALPGEPPSRYRYLFELKPTSWRAAEVIADRRLIWLELEPTPSSTPAPATPSRRGRRARRQPRGPLRCVHPDAPRRQSEARQRRLGEGTEHAVYREWIDLRMYCWGRALETLDRGARVSVHFGPTRPRRGAWVARRRSTSAAGAGQPSASRDSVARLDGASFVIEPKPPDPTPLPAATPEQQRADDGAGSDAPAIRVRMRNIDRPTRGFSFQVTLRATARRSRIYLRYDQFRFRIHSLAGDGECGIERTPIVPIIDFYRSISNRRGVSQTIDASQICPDEMFKTPGVYEITPVVELPYDGSRYDIEAITGTFLGDPALVRIRKGRYVEQTVLAGEIPR